MNTHQTKKRHHDVLESRTVESADSLIDGEEAHQVPLVVKTAYEEVKKELRKVNRLLKEKKEEPVVKHKAPKKESNGHHPAITGLSVGGAKEVLDYIFETGFEGDTVTLGFLDLPFIDGAIIALITMVAAFLAKGSRK